MSQFFFNQHTHLVNDVIGGTIITSPWSNLARPESDPVIRIVVRRSLNKNNVAIISGGGLGHEPAHVGSINKGMLTAAVYGDVFVSPSVDAVLAATQAVTDEADCLLIAKNYTGDRLNFGLAAEKTRHLSYSIETLIVDDDIPLPSNKHPHSIAGAILVHKTAGYFAEHGYNLAIVLCEAQYAANNTLSLGITLSSCYLPQKTDAAPRHHPGHTELGVGIHGEPGVSVIDTQNSVQVVNLVVDGLLAALPETGRLAMVTNNLGGVSVAEVTIITRELASSPLHPRINWLIDPTSLVTALDVKGFSLAAIVLEESIEEAPLTEMEINNWPTPVPPREISCVPLSQHGAHMEFQPLANALVARIVELVTTTLSDLEARLNALDAEVGDGDIGSTFIAGAREIAGLLRHQQLPLDSLATLFALIGERLTMVMGGSSGVLISVFFTATGQRLEQGTNVTEAPNTGLAQMKLYGGANEGDRTMTDALQPTLASLFTQSQNLQAAFDATQTGAGRTCLSSEANAGRTSYLSNESLLGNMDPGTHTVAMVFRALTENELD